MLNFKDISLVRVENKQIFALVIGGSELWVRRQDSPVLALQVSEWVRFATGRRVEEIVSFEKDVGFVFKFSLLKLKMENVSEAKKVNTKLVKTLVREAGQKQDFLLKKKLLFQGTKTSNCSIFFFGFISSQFKRRLFKWTKFNR